AAVAPETPSVSQAYHTHPAYLSPVVETTPAACEQCCDSGCRQAQFAQCCPPSDLPRLGPHAGACEAGWFHGRLWYSAEYLAWATKGVDFPVLVTTGDSSISGENAGALGLPDIEILFGGAHLHDDMVSGGRFTLGYWATPCQRTGVEAALFGIGGRDIRHRFTSEDFPVIARPYTDATNTDPKTNQESLLIAYPDMSDVQFSGSTRVDADMDLIGGEVQLRQALLWREKGRIDVLAGYRHAFLFDQLAIHDESVALDMNTDFAEDTVITRDDLFRTKNYFHGGQLGFATRLWRGCWSCSLTTKAAYGGVRTRSTVFGQTDEIPPNTPPGDMPVYKHNGVLGQPSNNGLRIFEDQAFLGEIGLQLEYQLTCRSRIALGYTFLYWDSVVRQAPLIDTMINPDQIPPGAIAPGARPKFTLVRDDFWAQGLKAVFEHQF
ncbi:MAG: BBP7 family outer membrane beta-barrel protein, partial [Planctomycetales bacterium]|nr:BBP7 family outer membrane beta-barrel protein [Planctomycetales bacterium]